MTRVEIEGGSYGEALPGGAFAVLVSGRHIQTHQGHVLLPVVGQNSDGEDLVEDVLFLRCTDVGGFKMAGQGQGTGAAWLWREGIWTRAGTTHGVSPCIFDRQGILHVATVAQGSQGYRQVSETGRLITGDETYADPSRRIWEYTTFDDVTIGQGENCALAISPFGRRVLEPGDCRFIRLPRRNGDPLAITIVKLAERKTVLLWMAVAELATLPLESTTAPPPPPPPPLCSTEYPAGAAGACPICGHPKAAHPLTQPEPQTMQYNTGPLNTYAQRRWQELPHETRHEQAAALHRILWEFRRDSGDPIETFRKHQTNTTFGGSDGHHYAEDICVINEGGAGKWYKDVGVAFGSSSARLDFGHAGSWQHPNGSDADQCFPPPKPSDVVEPPPVDPPPVDPPPPPFNLEAFKHDIAGQTAAQINGAIQAQNIPGLTARLAAVEELLAHQPPSSGEAFDPSKYQTKTKVNLGFREVTYTGTIKKKP